MLKHLLIIVWLLALGLPAGAAEQDLLEPDQAFRFSAHVLSRDALEVRYQVAPGYYLYRDKFKFVVEPAQIELGTPELPPGKLKKDEFFGEVETYRGEVRIRLPVKAGSAREATLTATSQGCADAGVCYVPHDQTARLTFASAGATSGSAAPRSQSAGSGR